jgi:hypothetical protein
MNIPFDNHVLVKNLHVLLVKSTCLLLFPCLTEATAWPRKTAAGFFPLGSSFLRGIDQVSEILIERSLIETYKRPGKLSNLWLIYG